MKVLSLFDGMCCGMLAMQAAGVEVDRYVAYEIDKYAIKVASHNSPQIEQCGDVFKADFTQYEGLDYLIGGSPCTYWSIAQKNNRETEASGLGWELFSQYVRALHEAKPKFFIYENNKSMSKQIRASIDKTFGFEAVGINSALVSAQNRQRLYWVGKRNPDGTYSQVAVEQPEDRGILLRDILETGIAWQEKSYTLKAQYYKNGMANFVTNGGFSATGVAEPIRIGTIENDAKNPDHDSQQYRVYSPDGKGVTLCGQGGGVGAKTGLYAVPFEESNYTVIDGANVIVTDDKIRQGNSAGTKQGKYVYTTGFGKSNTLTAGQLHNERVLTKISGRSEYKTIYEVRNGLITIKDKQYQIKLADGFYIIRKLTVSECKRLQTVPEWYDFSVISNSQAYKCLGNGWTVEVIAHLINATAR